MRGRACPVLAPAGFSPLQRPHLKACLRPAAKMSGPLGNVFKKGEKNTRAKGSRNNKERGERYQRAREGQSAPWQSTFFQITLLAK